MVQVALEIKERINTPEYHLSQTRFNSERLQELIQLEVSESNEERIAVYIDLLMERYNILKEIRRNSIIEQNEYSLLVRICNDQKLKRHIDAYEKREDKKSLEIRKQRRRIEPNIAL